MGVGGIGSISRGYVVVVLCMIANLDHGSTAWDAVPGEKIVGGLKANVGVCRCAGTRL